MYNCRQSFIFFPLTRCESNRLVIERQFPISHFYYSVANANKWIENKSKMSKRRKQCPKPECNERNSNLKYFTCTFFSLHINDSPEGFTLCGIEINENNISQMNSSASLWNAFWNCCIFSIFDPEKCVCSFRIWHRSNIGIFDRCVVCVRTSYTHVSTRTWPAIGGQIMRRTNKF